MEMNPKELVEALRRCANGESEECPFTERGVCGCPEMSADQIERDQKEIAELRAALEKATEMADALNKKCDLITKKLEQLSGAHSVVGDSDDAEGGLRMERLTFEGNFCEIARCKEVKCPYDTNCSQKQVWERLKQYEDTKRTPEQIEALEAAIMGKAVTQITEFEGLPIARLRDLAVADKDGRVVVLKKENANE